MEKIYNYNNNVVISLARLGGIILSTVNELLDMEKEN